MLILARHGNTFEKHETPVWVGARTDLPLTAEGMAQAERVGLWLEKQGWIPSQAIAGPLKRTWQFGEKVAAYFKVPLVQDDRLRELDYGLWEGLSGEEIRTRFGAEELDAWEKEGRWPQKAHWPEEEKAMLRRLENILIEHHDKAGQENIFLCTSNGILRLIWRLVMGKNPGSEAKVPTGHLCVLEVEGKGYKIRHWAVSPKS